MGLDLEWGSWGVQGLGLGGPLILTLLHRDSSTPPFVRVRGNILGFRGDGGMGSTVVL